MDKNYTMAGILMLAVAFGILFLQQQDMKRQAEERAAEPPTVEQPVLPDNGAGPGFDAPGEGSTSVPSMKQIAEVEEGIIANGGQPIISNGQPEAQKDARPPEETYEIENDLLRVVFTTYGGAIKEVALKDYPAINGQEEPYIFNQGSELPALSISLADADGSVEEYAPAYRFLSGGSGSRKIEFAYELVPGVELVRAYEVSNATEGASPYIIKHSTRFQNQTPNIFSINHIFVNVGTAPPTDADPSGYHLNFSYYDGEDYEYISRNKFEGGGFWGFFKRDPATDIQRSTKAVWASAKNQFFAAIVTPENPGIGIFAQPASLPPKTPRGEPLIGITGAIEFDLQNVNAHSERTLSMDLYVGPKEYSRLISLDQRQEYVMQLGFFGIIGKFLLWMLLALHNMVGNYGVAIIMMTIIIRLTLWPLTAKAAQSSKKMQTIQEPLKEIKEKYKDQPEKIQKETLKLFQQHKINPAAGCLPILIQMPIFFGLFQMLRSASELRFAHFLWIEDLSLEDTVATIGGFPFNPLPLVMGVTMYYQMKMTPMNMDSAQQKIFKMLPFFFLIICYNFSSGLVLYWTVSNCFTILQQFITNRRKDAEEPTKAPALSAQVVPAGRKKKKLKNPPKK